jgi:hypothetical protein
MTKRKYHQAEATNLKDVVILDTISNIGATITKSDLLAGLRVSDSPIEDGDHRGNEGTET